MSIFVQQGGEPATWDKTPWDPKIDVMQVNKDFKPDPTTTEKQLYVQWLRDNLRHVYATKLALYQAIRATAGAPAPVIALADPNETAARLYLAAQQHLRLYLIFRRSGADDRAGAGHLAAARASVDNLLLLGFRGNLEVIYFDNQWTKRDIVGAGFPAFPGGNMAGAGGHCTVSYIKIEDVAHATKRESGLINNLDIFRLGNDTFRDVVDDLAHSEFGTRNPMNVNKMVVLKAFGWDQGFRWIFNYANNSYQELQVGTLAGYRGAPAANANAFEGLAPSAVAAKVAQFMDAPANQLNPANPNAKKTLAAILERVHRREIELVVGYGLHNGGTPTTIHAIAKAVRGAMPYLKSFEKDNKPAVILFLRNENITPNKAFTDDGFRFFSAGANGTNASIAGLSAGQIAVVNAPGVPRDVFNQFMMSSTLPFFLEGAGSATTALTLGIPFIGLKDNDSIVDVPNTTPATTSNVLRAHGQWLTSANHIPSANEITALARSLVDARRAPRSPPGR